MKSPHSQSRRSGDTLNADVDVFLIQADTISRKGRESYFYERDMARANRADTIADIVAGQIENVRRVISFNVVEGWARDVSEDIALDALNTVLEDRQGIPDYLREFFLEHLGDAKMNGIEDEDYVSGTDRSRHM